jgi:hypothetical protein
MKKNTDSDAQTTALSIEHQSLLFNAAFSNLNNAAAIFAKTGVGQRAVMRAISCGDYERGCVIARCREILKAMEIDDEDLKRFNLPPGKPLTKADLEMLNLPGFARRKGR